MLSQPDHPVRQDYEGWLQDYIGRLRSDPALAAQAEALKQRAIDHPKVQEYVRGLWDDIHAALRDLSTPDSALAAHLESALLAMGRRLAEDAALREALNRHVLGAARRLTGRLRAGVTAYRAHRQELGRAPSGRRAGAERAATCSTSASTARWWAG